MNRRPDAAKPCIRSFALAAAAMLLALPAGCDAGADAPPSRPEIEAFIETTLPPNLVDLHVADESGIDRLMRLRFDAPNEEAGGFAARLLPDGLEAGVDPGLRAMGSDLDWWIAAMPPGAEGGGATAASNRVRKIVSAPADSGARRVWLAVFTQ